MSSVCQRFIRPAIGVGRSYCYKQVKRVDLSATRPQTKLVEKAESQLSLTKQLQAKITHSGPVTVAEYMRDVLTSHAAGYYMKKDVFGSKGDFVTSPEIGQIFGELVAIWCISEWQKCGAPKPLQLVELGPGRGTLSKDVLRVFAQFGLYDNLSLHLVEISPHLSDLQAKLLCCKSIDGQESADAKHYKYGETVSGMKVYWYQTIDDVPNHFTIYLAHEFFDALPIHKFQKVDGNWREILVDNDGEERFRFVAAPRETKMLNHYMERQWKHDVSRLERVEFSAETEVIVEKLAVRLEEDGGIALIVDYGGMGESGETFRAFKDHKLHDPLVQPGTADLTADVNFRDVKGVAEHLDRTITFGPIEQRDFLQRMGGEERLKVLLEKAESDEVRATLQSGYEMLSSPTQMGSRFKFFSIFPKVLESHLNKFPVYAFNARSK